jgi:hypothetical protein
MAHFAPFGIVARWGVGIGECDRVLHVLGPGTTRAGGVEERDAWLVLEVFGLDGVS